MTIQEAQDELNKIRQEFPDMLTPNYPTAENVKRVLLECEDFNKDKKTIEQIQQELGVEIDPVTAIRIAHAINMAQDLDQLKDILEHDLDLEEEEAEDEVE